MNKITKFTLAACVLLGACSDQTSDSKSVTQTPVDQPNRFFDAAVSKLEREVQGVSKQQATCMLESMLADGRLGLGEINQVVFNEDGSVERKRVAKALEKAKSDCL